MGSWFAFVIDGVGSWRLTGGFGKETCAVKRHVSQIYNSTLLHHCLVSTFPDFLPSVFDKAKKKKTLSYCLYSSWAAERSDARRVIGSFQLLEGGIISPKDLLMAWSGGKRGGRDGRAAICLFL